MIKIIKYSITLIIFSIISSLFILYFYLLKGITLNNIHYENFAIEKLYIKIDKKIILKTENITIKQKNNQKQPSSINFKETTTLIKKVLQYFPFFQEVKIKNLNINNNEINLISLYKNRLTLDTNDIFLQASLFPQKNNIIFNIYELNIKKYDIIFNNITGNFYSDLLHLYIKIKNIYKQSEIKFNITLSNNNFSYKGEIYNINKKLLNIPIIKDKLKNIKLLNIYSLKFNGNKENIHLLAINNNISIDKLNIKIPSLKLDYKIEKNKFIINIANINVIYDKKYIINLSNTSISQKNNKIIITNTLTNILNNNIKAILQKNNIIYDYTNNNAIAKISNANISYNDIKANINNIKINYKKNLFINIPNIGIKKNNLFSKLINTNIYYNLKTNIVKLKNNKIYIKDKDLQLNAIINNNNLIYKNNTISIDTNNGLISYKSIKNIKLNNINSAFDLNTNYLNIYIPTLNINKIKLNNTKVSLQKNILNIIFDTNTLLSKKLNKILSVFGINISIYQTSGKNNILAYLHYNLNNNNLKTNLKIDVNNSKLMLSDTTFLYIRHSNLELKDSNISLTNTDLDYNQSIVNLNYHINKGLINLNKSYIQTYGTFKDLNLTNIVEIKNYPENLYINLNDLNISLQNLKTDILINNDIDVYINKISKFYPYISYLQEYNITNGKIKVKIADDIKIITNITKTNQTILENNLTPITKLDINTTIKDNNITIFHPKLRINILTEKNETIINGGYKNLDINITKFVDTNKSEDNSSTMIKAKIFAKNTNILYNDIKLYSDILHIDYNTTNAKIESLYKDRNITILYNNGGIKIYGLKIKDKTFKDLTNTNILNKPYLTFFALQNKDSKIMQGFIDIKAGYIKELKAFTNVLAFINLIPSLVTFQAVGFTSKGYKIKHGWIEYMLYNNILYFKDINIKGENLTFDGQGYIDLDKKTIKLNVNVNLLIKLVKDIPIVNYILLGKDGGITIKLTIDGDIKDPQVHKNTASNIIEAPLGILKRALLTPFRPFMKEEK